MIEEGTMGWYGCEEVGEVSWGLKLTTGRIVGKSRLKWACE